MRCHLCSNILPVYKIGGGGYTLANTGASPVPCPVCAASKENGKNEKISSKNKSAEKRRKAQSGSAEISV